jgi:hypothetical protein
MREKPTDDEMMQAIRKSGFLMATQLEPIGLHVSTNRAF